MARQGWQWLTVAGLCGVLGVAAGCTERQEEAVRQDARQVGKEVGEAAKDVEAGARKAAEQTRDAAREASDGFREGTGGSGNASPGTNPRVIEDGDGTHDDGREAIEENDPETPDARERPER
ncbi:hypothetical protein [Pyxidicoccus fallax]|uniref:hypothetical protein n=1 Tax=Pyxidicoccus fallax TaxID=394095 RepID=UPI001B7D72F4|nr:hypothetical protein [Pyxidicoccus fallax]